MENENPEWLTDEFIKKSLESEEESDTITIQDLQISRPVDEGNNYVCNIHGVQVTYTKSNDAKTLHKTSLIVKSPIKGKMYREMLETGIIQKEVLVYNELMPKLRRMFRQTENGDVLPKSYPSSVENVIVLEDLKSKGYKMADRLKQLDYDHSVIALKSLSKFHAATFVLHHKEPDIVEKIGKESFFYEGAKDIFKDIMVNNFKMYGNEIKKWPEIAKYSKWFEINSDNIWDVLLVTVVRKENEFSVLNHGDFWVSNMLFKYDENDRPVQVIPIDFQIPRYTSPALDFQYFMCGSVQEDVREEKYEQLVHIYVDELNSNLQRYGSSDRLDESDFKRALEERSFFSVLTSLNLLPIVIADPKKVKIQNLKDVEMDEFKSIDGNPFKEFFKNEKLIKILESRFQQFERMGLISSSSSSS